MKTRDLLPLCLPLLASIAFANPIRVSGGGTFVADWVTSDSTFTISFSGSNGVDSIQLGAQCRGGVGTSVSGDPVGCSGSATIDGFSFSEVLFNGESFSFAVGNGSGYASGRNPDLNQFAGVSLIGYVDATVGSCIGTYPQQTCRGSFVVLPTPEPGSITFALLGLGAIALRIANKRIRV